MICYHCKHAVPPEGFCPSSLARRDYICRACLVAKNKKWRHANAKRAKEGARMRMRKWRQAHPDATYTPSSEAIEREKQRQRAFAKANREKKRAHLRVHYAIKTGKLVRKSCEVCGEPDAHAHHDDYSKPLDVRWLCPTHHNREHRWVS